MPGHPIHYPVDAPDATNDANLLDITVLVNNPMPTAHIVAHDVLIQVIDLKDTMYTDQTGCFPFVSSLGNRFHCDPPPRGLQLLLKQGSQE